MDSMENGVSGFYQQKTTTFVEDVHQNRLQPDRGIIFSGITYNVKVGLIKKTPKVILDDVSGVMGPGLNAIMGPTGSGKTSLMDILAGRKSTKNVTGTFLVNGKEQSENFNRISGYVVQDDVIMGTLTVKENLYFSAALRLPSSMSWKEKKQRVKRVIDELGLNSCENTKIGNDFFRGVSGGERKRTNIGMELIIEPEVLFLDEPTTGLDAFTAVATVQLLKHLATNGKRTIIMSIHQPRYAIYKLFDTLTLLSKGRMVYHGLASQSLEYFSALGYACEDHDNPADFLLDVINKCEQHGGSDLVAIETGEPDCEMALIDLGKSYSLSKERKESLTTCQEMLSHNQQHKSKFKSSFFSRSRYTSNIFWQLFVVMIRSTVNLARNPMTSTLQYIITIVFGILVGAVYFQLDTGQNGYQNRIGAIFFIVMNQVFGNLSAIDLFVQQKALFLHESASGYYRASAYFIAKVSCDILTTRLFPLCFFTLIAYFMLGFQLDVAKFFIFFLTLFLTSFAASAIAFWVSAGVKVAGIGNLLTALCFVVQMLFGGFLLTLDSLPVYFRWLQYFSLFRYSVEALIVNEVDGLVFNQTINGESLIISGRDLLDSQGFKVEWLWYDQIGLAGLCVLFLTLGYITLRAIKK